MVVTPERKMSACSLSPGKNLALVAVMWVWLLMWYMSAASTSWCDFLPWFALGQLVTRCQPNCALTGSLVSGCLQPCGHTACVWL